MLKIRKDLTGKKFGRLTVLKQTEDYVSPNGLHCAVWTCRCDCGQIVDVRRDALTSGRARSCGCLQREKASDIGKSKLNDLSGKRFGKLEVLELADDHILPSGTHEIMYKCKCDCGNTTVVSADNLRRGITKSCGCLKFHDLTGKRFGRLTVVERADMTSGHGTYWKCRCDCGNITIVNAGALVSGSTRSCGCLIKDVAYNRNIIDLTGQRFGKLTVIERADGISGHGTYWRCRCDCGNEKIISSNCLRSGSTQSCGCTRISHGEMKISSILTQNNVKFKTEYMFNDLVRTLPLRFDFAVFNDDNSLHHLIEFDGEQHFRANGYLWNTESQLRITKDHDMAKNNYCLSHHIPLIRIPYTHIKYISYKDLMPETSPYLLLENN